MNSAKHLSRILGISSGCALSFIALNKSPDPDGKLAQIKSRFLLSFFHDSKIEKKSLAQCIRKAQAISEAAREEFGAPGLVVGVSVNGSNVWSEGFGFSDVENEVRAKAETSMRIASISKSLTAVVAGRLVDEGKLDWDKSIYEYLREGQFPRKKVEGKEVDITVRMLASHLSGIRHYKKAEENGKEKDEKENRKTEDKKSPKKKTSCTCSCHSGDGASPEFYSTENYSSVSAALSPFADDDLVHKPGSKFLYTTYGYTLLSAVIEESSGKSFQKLVTDLTRLVGMPSTTFDENAAIIANRSRYYQRNCQNKLRNAPSVNNSNKWAGGGLVSTVGDLVKFGNALITAHQMKNAENKCVVSPQVLEEMLAGEANAIYNKERVERYGLGFVVIPKDRLEKVEGCERPLEVISHTGGAVGASSVLLIIPEADAGPGEGARGICVAILCNLQSVGLSATARRIAREFDGVVDE